MFDLCSDCRTANFFREGLGLPVAEVNERFAEVQVRLWPIAFSVLACYEECPTKKKPVYKDADALRAQAGDINIVLKASDGFLCPSQTQSTISCHKNGRPPLTAWAPRTESRCAASRRREPPARPSYPPTVFLRMQCSSLSRFLSRFSSIATSSPSFPSAVESCTAAQRGLTRQRCGAGWRHQRPDIHPSCSLTSRFAASGAATRPCALRPGLAPRDAASVRTRSRRVLALPRLALIPAAHAGHGLHDCAAHLTRRRLGWPHQVPVGRCIH
jgi:hypothetical protein